MGSGGGLVAIIAAHTQDYAGDCNCSEYVLDVPFADHVAAMIAAHLEAVATEAREAIADAIDDQYEWQVGEWGVNSHKAADAAAAAFIKAVTG